MGEMKTTTVTLEDYKRRQHFGLLLRPRNQVAVMAVVKPILSVSKQKVRQMVSKHKEHLVMDQF